MEKLKLKLLQFQTEIETIKKDGKNTFFKKPDGKASTYATLPNILNEVTPLLNALKIVILQPIKNGHVYTTLIDTESNDVLESCIELPTNISPQHLGSAITYFRRYTLVSLLSLQIEEDDDGNASSNPTKTEAKDEKQWLNKYADKAKTKTTELWDKVYNAVGEGKRTIAQVEAAYKLSNELKDELIKVQQTGI